MEFAKVVTAALAADTSISRSREELHMSNSIRPPFKDILQSIPGVFGIRLEEEPAFRVLSTIGDVEIRHYAAALLAQVTVPGDHDHAVSEAFTTLAAYIFGKNASQESSHMTSPVFQEQRSESLSMTTPVLQNPTRNGWTVSFFLSNELTPETAPQPEDEGIRLVMQPETIIGSLRYSGNNSEESRAKSKRSLLAAIAGDGSWRVVEDVSWAQYDQPFAIPFLKRNEAHVALERLQV